jgi:hypothetical protein
MKYICLGYMDEQRWEAMSKAEQEAMMEECLAYDDVLTRRGHWTGAGESLQKTTAAKSLRLKDGKLIVTDGPYAETKEQLGGFGTLEARDMDQAVELMSKHPGVRYGPFEIRPVDEKMTSDCESQAGSSVNVGEGVKILCLGYGDEDLWEAMPASQREALLRDYIAYGEYLRQRGSWVGGVALQSARSAKTLRYKDGKVLVSDGPYAETKEVLGGVATLKFRDMAHAVESWSQHPCLRMGDTLELRPADEEFAARWEERQRRVNNTM